MNVKAGNGDDKVTFEGSKGGNTVEGGKGNDTVDFGGSGGNTYVYSGGDDTVSGFNGSTDKLKISGTISAVSISESSISVEFKNGNTLNVEGSNLDKMEKSGQFVYANGRFKLPVEEEEMLGLADSADLIYDDDNFTDYGLSEIVNDSLDTYSVGSLNETKNLNELTAQSDFLTYGNDDNNNK